MTKQKPKKRPRGSPRLAPEPRAYALLLAEMQRAQAVAAATGTMPDFSGAVSILHRYPTLARHLEAQRQREEVSLPHRTRLATLEADQHALEAVGAAGTRFISRGRPHQQAAFWGGSGRQQPQGVPNARLYREIAERDVWVRAAIDERCAQVSCAEVAVLPLDERRPWDKGLQQEIQYLLDQPNEEWDSWRTLIQPVVEDILVLDRGVIEKGMQLKPRVPSRLYHQDGARIKIYADWSGDPQEPRYLFEEEGGTNKRLLLNDECIVMIARPASYRLGLAPVATLYDVVNADLRALASGAALVDNKPPPHLIQVPKASQTAITKMRDTYDMEVAGRRELMWIGGNEPAKVFPLMFSARDNQWLEWQIYLARQICAAFKISPQQIGITFDINRATSETQQEIYEDSGYIPLLLLIEEYLNQEIVKPFARQRARDGRYDTRALNLGIIFPAVSEAQRKKHFSDVMNTVTKGQPGLPVLMPNDIRRILGEEPVPGGNRFWTFNPTAGPQPWLGYDDELGLYTPPNTGGQLGAPDPATGPQAQDVPASLTVGDETSGTGDMPSFDDGSAAPAGVTPAAPADGDAAASKAFRAALAHKRAGPSTGIMVAFFLDQQTAETLAWPHGEPAEELHVTLAYLGDMSEWGPGDANRLKQAVAGFAAGGTPLAGRISGIGRFTSVPEGQPEPLYASVDVPGLAAFREALVRRLTVAGFPPDETHGFTPHVVLAYLDPDDALPAAAVPALPVRFDRVWLVLGGARYPFALEGQPPVQLQPPPAPVQKAARSLTPYQPVAERRQPGKHWSSVWHAPPDQKARAQPGGKIPPHLAAAFTHPPGEQQARSATQAAIAAIFEEVIRQGQLQARL